MRAYAVFAGGGVKGAAHAGALLAAQRAGIEFVGFGGTSAGSIVALLAAVGYSGEEIGVLMKSTDFTALLDDGGARLRKAKRTAEAAERRFAAGQQLVGACRLRSLILDLWTSLGFYDGTKLREFLTQLTVEKLSHAGKCSPETTDVGFSDLSAWGCKPLKVVASDITNRRAVVFPQDPTVCSESVITAVHASSAFPFVFAPVTFGNRKLIDGGIASNLPSFLFHREFKHNSVRTLAFDLVQQTAATSSQTLISHMRETLDTALTASDIVLRTVTDGIVHIPIPTPQGVNTFDVDVTPSQREQLFDCGYRAAGEFLASYTPLARARTPGLRLQQILMTEYGDPKLYQPVLQAVVRDVEEFTRAAGVRANIMLSTGRGTRIVVYQEGMSGATDSDFELPEDAGCSGAAWKSNRPVFADLSEAPNQPKWLMSMELHAKVPKDRKAMFSVPIPGKLEDGESAEFRPIGTLSVDSSTPLADTEWVNANETASPIVKIMMGWAYVIARLLP